MFIYLIVNSETLKMYVGQHKGSNLRQYLQQKLSEARRGFGGRSRLYASMRKHPREAWSIWPLVSGIETRAELDEVEKHFIRVLKAQHPDVGYNICEGGEGFTGPHTENTKRRIRKAMRGRVFSPEALEKMAAAARGNLKGRANLGKRNPKDAAFRKRVSETLTGRAKSAEHAQHIGDGHRGLVYNLGNSWNVGRKASAETREKMSAAHRKEK